MIVNGNLKFHTLGAGEIQNAIMETFTTAARDALTGADLVAGRLIYNTTTNLYNFYDGTQWVVFASGGSTGAIQTELDTTQASMGYVNADGTFNQTALNALGNVTGLTGSSTLVDALTQLDTAISNAAGIDTLAELTDVTLTTPADNDVLQFNSVSSIWENKTIGVASGIQAQDAVLDDLSALAVVANDQFIIGTGAGTYGYLTMSPFGQSLVDDIDAATARTTLGVVIGTDVQAYDLALDNLSAVTGTGFLVQTGLDTFITTSLAASTVPGDQGISITDPSGVGDAPTIGLDIVGLTAEAGVLSSTDVVALYDGVNNVKASVADLTAGVVATGIALNDLSDVDDAFAHTANAPAILMGDGINLDVVSLVAGNDLSGVAVTGTSLTLNVDDSFLRNTGDTLDSGTLSVASGAAIAVLTGANITAVDAPTAANDLTNKAYVDALVASGTQWRDSLVDSDLVDVVAVNPATPELTYGLSTGDNVAFIATATFTFSLGIGTTVAAVPGDIVNLTITSAGNGDYTKIESPLSAGDRFILGAEHGSAAGIAGGTLGSLDVNADTFTLAKGDLIEFTGVGDGSTAASWSTPEGRGGLSGGSPEIVQGITVLVSDPNSVHYGHTYLYDAVSNSWLEIAGPGFVGAGTGLFYVGNTLNVGLGAGILELPSDQVGVDVHTAGGLFTTVDNSTSSTVTGAQLAVKLDGTTLSKSAAGLKVGTINNTEIGASAGIQFSKLEALTSANIIVGSAGNVPTAVAMSGDVTIDNLGVTTIGAGAVVNTMLANSSINFTDGTTSSAVALGGTLTISTTAGAGISVTQTGGTYTIDGIDATTVVKGVASFNGAHFSVTAGAVSLAASLSDLTDVKTTVDGTVDAAGSMLVGDGVAGYEEKLIQFNYSSAVSDGGTGPKTSHTVNHNLGQQFVNVTVVDSTNAVIIPQSITFTNANTVTVTFNTAIDCRVVVMGVPGTALTGV